MTSSLTQIIGPIWNIATLEFIIKFTAVYILILWIVSILWIASDISSRSKNIFLQIIWISGAICLPFITALFYILFRPRRMMFEVLYNEIEGNLSILSENTELKLEERFKKKALEGPLCPHCSAPIENSFLVCPQCAKHLRVKCHGCKKRIRKEWHVCPHCNETQNQKKTDA